ncbi:uroporphyrinogen-III C-methyltransferase [Alkalibacter rhizosphaerae]|uniref:uroporphyrinogen-III C-methyltransferase n=1 Tax=Alkalibacter rhizosphaerae TaxID=2815577 RepID=A0A975AI91_9FIRM|nr:uroporphyrinogen-III C-methyltransferase [Alkalibacter rhizosphaerae]QSX08828.1 uroporphyrinogen-III C-methyltransferase [Alkalibacter rhizosphaerae]
MKQGMVYITGAGPGDEGLITVAGLKSIKNAQVLVYDRLAGAGLVAQAPEDCEKIYVGKESSNHTMTQDEINRLLYEKAKEGHIVTRLKGGDPYVFGRGGEEALYLEERGISYEVIPGITSGIGGLAYTGIPITHRDHASSFHIITGHLKDEDRELDWETLAKLKGTLVFYMGMAQLETIAQSLMEYGMDKTTPVALVQWATTFHQRSVTGNLENIMETAKKEKISSPVLIVVGKVVELKDKLNFFERKPLRGKRVLVTRARAQNSKLSERIRGLGGETVEFPMIHVEKSTDTPAFRTVLKQLGSYDWLVFTSQNGVEFFFDSLFENGFDVRKIGKAKIAVIGNATSDALKKYGIRADLIPEHFVAESLLTALSSQLKDTDQVLLLQAEGSRPVLKDGLEICCMVDSVDVYRTVRENAWEEGDLVDYLKNNRMDAITLTSSSTATYLWEALKGKEELLDGIPLISIGPVTSQTMKELGFPVAKEADPHNIDGLITALLEGVKA